MHEYRKFSLFNFIMSEFANLVNGATESHHSTLFVNDASLQVPAPCCSVVFLKNQLVDISVAMYMFCIITASYAEAHKQCRKADETSDIQSEKDIPKKRRRFVISIGPKKK